MKTKIKDELIKIIDMKSDNQSEKYEKTDVNKKVNDNNFTKKYENTKQMTL